MSRVERDPVDASRVQVAIVGFGRIGRQHAQALEQLPYVRLAAVVDPDPAALAECPSHVHRYGTMKGILDDGRVQAVVLCSPTYLHTAQAMTLLRAGKHVLVEKPAATTAREAQQMWELARAQQRILMSGQVMRFMPIFQQAREAIRDGLLGRPIHFLERRLVFRDEVFPWWSHQAHFLLQHWSSHSLDLIIWLTGARCKRVFALTSSVHSAYPGEDDLALLCEFVDDFKVSLHHSFSCRHPVHDMTLIGERGTLVITGFERLDCNGETIYSSSEEQSIREGLGAQMAEFIDAIRGRREPLASIQTVLPMMHILDAALESARVHAATGVIE